MAACSNLAEVVRLFARGLSSFRYGSTVSIYSRRLVHLDKANKDDGVEKTSTTAEQADEMPVFIDNDLIANMLDNMKDDTPVSSMPDPFKPEHKRCILCEHNIDVDYKNVRLLSQFVSPYTGRIYGRAVTGLCIPMQKHVSRMIIRSRKSGFMPFILKHPKYLKDPKLFDPFKPTKSAK